MSKSYQLRQTTQFRKDFKEALRYIAVNLQNPIAADAMVDTFDEAAEQVRAFPFAVQAYPTYRQSIYRAINVKNYLAFYVVLDDAVEFRRFLYAGSDILLHL